MREWRAEVRQRLAAAKLDGAVERDIVEELAQHLEDRYAELCALGVATADARAQVLAELEGDDALARRVRGIVPVRPVPLPIGRATFGGFASGVWSDIHFGARALVRSPIYAGFAVLVLALGIGATTAIFTVVNSVLLQPPPGVREPDRLAAVYTSDFSGPRFGASSYPDVMAMREAGSVFEDVAAYSLQAFSIAGDGWNTRGLGEIVSGDYFRVLGVQPAIGRFFSAEEGEAGRTTSVAVISHELWSSHFGGGADAPGATIRVKGQPLTVVGVAPREFGGSLNGLRAQLWLPLSARHDLTGVDPSQRGHRGFLVRARLREGVKIEMAQRALDVVASRLHGEHPEDWTDIGGRSRVFTVLPESAVRVPPQARGAAFGGLAVLMAAVFAVLLIACTNVANLMLSRASVRRPEMGIRLALGATPGRIVRHILAESLLLASIGGVLGVLLAIWLLGLLEVVRLPGIQVTMQVGIDWRVLGFTTAVSVATGLVFGLAPALQASRAPAPLLKDDRRSGTRSRLRHALIVVQVACSMVLLIGGGVLLRSLRAMHSSDTGYATDNVVVATFDLEMEGYSPQQAAAFYDELLRRASAFPGTIARTVAEVVPLGMGWSRRLVAVEGYRPEAGEDMQIPFNGVGPDYFSTMGMTLRGGRDFTEGDRAGASPVVIVSEAFARRFWPNQNAIGKRVGLRGSDTSYAEVIGIAPDAKYRASDDAPQPYIYYPYLQHPSSTMALLARTAADPAELVATLREAIAAIAPSLPAPEVRTFRHHLAFATLPQRVAAFLASALGLLAVGIAIVGLYGIVAFGVAQRAREFGIRMALGAAAGDVRRLVIGDALRVMAIGIACGTPFAFAAAMLMRRFMLVAAIDPLPFLTVPALLAACALAASQGPARRATSEDPAAALRRE